MASRGALHRVATSSCVHTARVAFPSVQDGLGRDDERHAVDELLHTSQHALIQLSAIADQKANIVLGASLMMITIIVGLGSSAGLTASLATLGAFTVASSIAALMAVMPATGSNPNTRTSALYFGDVASMTEREHHDAMTMLIRSDDGVYRFVLTDIHQQSRNLQLSTFRYLRMSYSMFIVGLMVTSAVVTVWWATGRI